MPDRLFQGYALLIGVNLSNQRDLDLPVARKDIRALHVMLTDPEICAYPNNSQHIRKLVHLNTKYTDILESLSWLQQQAIVHPEATIFIYYSGHGCHDPKSDQFYLLPYDTDLNDLANTAISSERFTEAIQAIQSKHLLVVIDTCHAAGMTPARDGSNEAVKADLSMIRAFGNYQPSAPPRQMIDHFRRRGTYIFTASSGTQKSWNRPDRLNGIYTHHFLEALQGINNRSGDREVKVSNLINYLSRAVPESTYQLWNQIQTPQFDMIGPDFAIAKIRGGKGLPDRDYQTIWSEVNHQIYRISQTIESEKHENYIYQSDKCHDRQATDHYLKIVLQKLEHYGCVDVRQNITYEGQTFKYVNRIIDFEIPWQFILNFRGEAFFIFTEFASINFDILRQFSSRCLQWAKTQVSANAATSALWNMRLPSHNCFAVAIVDEIDAKTRDAVQTNNPFEYTVDLLWYAIPIIYELKHQELIYYTTPSSFKDQITGEVVWKKMRVLIEKLLSLEEH